MNKTRNSNIFYGIISENAIMHRKHKNMCSIWAWRLEIKCQNWWFWWFFTRNEQRSGRSVKVDETHIKVIIDLDRHSTTREIAEKLNVSLKKNLHEVKQKLKQVGYVKKLDLWIPHQLKEIHFTRRISICDSLVKRN